MKEIKILELFGGIGAIRKAFERLNIPHKVVDYVEIDKYAVKSYNAMFDENFECQDITNWDKNIDVDFIMHGSPCQDFSVAGKGAGGDLGSGTRSSLMYETIRIVGKLRPKYVMWENVKNLLSKKHKHNFDAYIETMNILGYNSYYQVLNAKDYGIPQNRERVYTISIRKDIDDGNFVFPEKEELKLRLKDMLENEVDEKYYLSDEISSKYIPVSESGNVKGKLAMNKWQDNMKRIYDIEKYSPALNTMQGGNTEPKILEEDIINPLKGISGKSWQFEQNVYSNESKCLRSIKAGGGSGNIPKIITYNVPQTVKVRKYDVDIDKLKQVLKEHKKYSNKEIALILDLPITTVEHWFRSDNCFSIPEPQIWLRVKSLLNIETDEFDKSIMTFEEKDGVYDKANRIYDIDGIMPTLTQQEEKIIEPKVDVIGNYMPSNHDASRIVNNEGLAPTVKENHGTVTATNYGYRIRKLTPKECWRLMGFDDEDFERAEKVNSNSQLYKQAGNSIVVNVLEKILLNLL